MLLKKKRLFFADIFNFFLIARHRVASATVQLGFLKERINEYQFYLFCKTDQVEFWQLNDCAPPPPSTPPPQNDVAKCIDIILTGKVLPGLCWT
jgi:hypothetical protein